MIDSDPVLRRLAELPALPPSDDLSERIRGAAHAALRPRPLHPFWALTVAASVLAYLGWAFYFTNALY